MKPHRLAVYGLAAGLLGGGAAGLTLTGATLASAQVSDVTGTVTDPEATTDSTAAGSPAKGDCGRGGRAHFGNLDAAAQALGMTADELRTALEGGKSLADVAKEKGVDVSKVTAALIAQFKAHLDEEVVAGKHTQAEADQILADAKSRIDAFVNGTAPLGGPGFGGRHGGRGHGRGFPAPAGSSGSGTSGTTTS